MAKLKISEQYGVIPNSVLHDAELSLKAKGLYGYIQSKPDGWEFSAERIMNECKDGLESVRAGLRELESSWYLIRHKTKNASGTFEYEYELKSEKPSAEKPAVENPTLENPPVENTPNKKERSTKKEIERKIEISPEGEGEAPETRWKECINDILRAYVETNGVLEGSEKENRKYAHLLSIKLDAIKGFDGRYYELVKALITWLDKYNARYWSSPKETYYNLAKLVAAKKSASRQEIQSF